MTRTFAHLAALLALTTPAIAAPPPPGSEDARIMAPFKEWIEHQRTEAGTWCCSISDGRPVDARVRDGHWEIFAPAGKFPGTAEGWIAVPDGRVLRVANPVGVGIAWVMDGFLYCFAPGGSG